MDSIIISCCCSEGVLEIRSPYSCTDKSFLEAVGEQRFCFQFIDSLKKDHTYYYQIMTQMKLCGSLYGDFDVNKIQ